ncbi:TPA: restriction endonuclease subunit S [Staphylococcus aureus]|uniref:restriction endonuclease subunit S n=1 Tax=Staphylococcus equorum TaxID=246432 RepID=UPI002968DBA6|nr:restriction endonuclease subunit S [Staphylococcus aureus]HDJ7547880.1 restriction endonuclease subunit S [Staphylococcus aureus]
MTEIANTPELRFPNYENSWFSYKLNDISERVTRKNKNLESQRPLTISGQLGLIDQIEYFNKSVSSKNLTGYTLIKKGEFAYNKSYSNGYPLGAIKKLERYDLGILSSLYICFSFDENIDKSFMKNYFESTKWYREVANIAVEGARNHGLLNIPVNDFFNININLPIQYEQEKIGEFFSKLDQQIELEEQKLEKLEEQKKGYMQQIFSQKLRFKDENGNDYPNWETEKLGNLINEVNERTKSNNQYVLLSSTKNGLLSQEEYFKKQIGSKDSTGYKVLRLNQLVLSPQNLWLGNINFNQRFDIGIVSPSYRIYNLSHHFDINFAKNLLKSPRYIYEYAQASEQGASVVRRNLNLDLFYSIKISLPSIEEQRKIGVFLNKLDKLIEKQSNEIELLKQRKKGLLQKMFV